MSYEINVDKYGFAEKQNPEKVSRDYAAEYVRKLVGDESVERQTGDNQLRIALEAEEEARQTADDEITRSITEETSARSTGDEMIRENLESETLARRAADNTLQANIDKEAEERKAADDEIRSNVYTKVEMDGLLKNKVDEEVGFSLATITSNNEVEVLGVKSIKIPQKGTSGLDYEGYTSYGEFSDKMADISAGFSEVRANIRNLELEKVDVIDPDAEYNEEQYATARSVANIWKGANQHFDAFATVINENTEKIAEHDTQIGNIETALDSIIAIQNRLMGVSE